MAMTQHDLPYLVQWAIKSSDDRVQIWSLERVDGWEIAEVVRNYKRARWYVYLPEGTQSGKADSGYAAIGIVNGILRDLGYEFVKKTTRIQLLMYGTPKPIPNKIQHDL